MASTVIPYSGSAIQDAVRAYQAQSSMPAGIGAATRELVTGPVSYGLGEAADLVKPVVRAGGEFFRGLTGGAAPGAGAPATGATRARGTIAPAPAHDSATARSLVVSEIAAGRAGEGAQMAPPVGAYGDPATGLRRGPITSSGTVDADGVRRVSIGDGATLADTIKAIPSNDPGVSWVLDPASGQARQMPNMMLAVRGGEAAARARDPRFQAARAEYDAGTVTPSLMPIAKGPVDPAAEYLKMRNNGSWDGMFAARKYADLLAGNRAAAVQATQAETGRIGAESSRLGAMASVANASTSAARAANDARLTDVQLAGEKQKQELTAIELADRQEMENLRRLAAQGDEKALARYRSVMAAKAGKDPTTQTNEKLLDAYIKSVGEFSKDPANMGKPAPTFQDFAAGLPPGMFPTIQQYLGASAALPPGAVKKVGTSNGRPVYLMRDGRQMVATQ